MTTRDLAPPSAPPGRIHRVAIGSQEAGVLDDGPLRVPAAFMFSNAPALELQRSLAAAGLATDAILAGLSGMLLTTAHGERVLLDVGAGDRWHEGLGALPRSLKLLGVESDEIDLVVVSHGHPDHLGGLLGPGGQLRYPNARYVMDAAEWRFWTSRDTLAGVDSSWAALAREVLPTLEGRIRLTEGEAEVADGLWTLPAPGHTAGHLGARFESKGETLLWFGDAFGHPLGVTHPDWMVATDADAVATVNTRRRLLDLAIHMEARVFVNHFAFPGLGRVSRDGQGTTWTAPVPTGIVRHERETA